MVRYGYGHLLERIVVMKGEQEVSEVNRLKAEVRKLKESVADLYLDLQIEKADFRHSARGRPGRSAK